MSVYLSFFGFRERPFHLTPDPRYLFLAPCHREALEHLTYGIDQRMGFIAVTGGIGTGKTTLCRALISRLDPSTRSALIFNPFVSDVELLRLINQEFGIKMDKATPTRADYLEALNRFLLETFEGGGNAALLVDEAQNLSPSALEQIRVLSNLETEKEKLLQIALVGQPELEDLLSTPSLKQLDDRIMVRYHLRPLDHRDVKRYIEHRMVVAGGRGGVRFTRGAFKRVYAYTAGNPRRINAVCDRALLLAYGRGKHTVTGDMVAGALKEIRGSYPSHGGDWTWRKAASYGLLLAMLVAVAGYAGWSYGGGGLLGLLGGEPEPPTRAAVLEKDAPPARRPEPAAEEETPVHLDEASSLSTLFRLSRPITGGREGGPVSGQVSLVSFDLPPEYYVMLKRPFRVRLESTGPGDPDSTPRYLVVSEVVEDGALAVDAGGRERKVSREFLLDLWGGEVAWVHPYEGGRGNLTRGMTGSRVMAVQEALGGIGYLVDPTGTYDHATSEAVSRFQEDFGLIPDGIVGPRTRALLFALSG